MHCFSFFFSNFAQIISLMNRFLFYFFVLMPLFAVAQIPTANPSVKPTATYYMTNEKGEEETDVITADDADAKILSAPVHIVFQANPTIPEGYNSSAHYTWTITNIKNTQDQDTETTQIVRNEENFEYDFNESGEYTIKLSVLFYDENGLNEENILYRISEDEDRDESPKVIRFIISESKLEFPNGISPNDDDKNDVLKPKEGFKNIVSFHAAVFNRWGQKLYSWDDIHGGWDGKYHGKVVKDGVYFLVVSAKGSDGINYNIKKAINVISGYNNENASNSGDNE